MTASPEVTGGAGFTFEDAVTAYYLVALLTESSARGLEGLLPTRVSLQRSKIGHPLDDIVVLADTPAGKAGLDLQAKRSFAFKANSSNTDFFDVVRQASSTLAGSDFREDVDRIGVATEEIAADHYRQLGTVCEWARDSVDPVDFLQRIETPGLAGEAKRDIVDALREGLAQALGRPAKDDEVHRFLRHFVILRFDLLGEAAADFDLVTDRIAGNLVDRDLGAARELWWGLRTIARDASGRAGSFDREILRRRLGRPGRFAATHRLAADIAKLSAEGQLAFQAIGQDIDGFVVPRNTLLEQIRSGLPEHRVLQIVGQPGSGKSALLRAAAEAAGAKPQLCLRSDRIAAGGWPAYANMLGLDHATPLPVLREMACIGEPVLFIDGLDRLVGKSRLLVQELVGTILQDTALSGWRIVVTLRDGGWTQVLRWLPALRRIAPRRIEVEGLTDAEAALIVEQRPRLHELLFGGPDVREISRRPFFLNVLASSVDFGQDAPSSETELIAAWWAGGGYDSEGAQTARRQEMLVTVARDSAATLGRGARVRGLDHGALESLKADHVLQDAEPGHTVSFAHDIFFEWAFAHLLMDAEQNWRSTLVSAGEPPALGRPVELLSQLRFERNQNWEGELDQLEKSETRTQWQRAWLIGPLSSPLFWRQSETFTGALLRGEGAPRLTRLLTWFQAVRAEPGDRAWAMLGELSETDAIRLADALSVPSDMYAWARLLHWLLSEQAGVPAALWPSVLTCAQVWQNGVVGYRNAVTEGLLKLVEAWVGVLEAEHAEWFSGGARRTSSLSHDAHKALLEGLRTFTFRAAVVHPEFTQSYLDHLLKTGHAGDAVGAIVDSAAFVARADPQRLSDLILLLARRRLPAAQMQYEREEEEERRAEALKHPEDSRERQLLMPSGLGGWIDDWDWDHLAIDGLEHQLGAPSPVTEPLRSLFNESSSLGLHTVKTLANHAVAAWRELHQLDRERGRTPLPLILDFPWGQQSFWGAEREYLLFRGVFAPQILTSAFMVLEAWAFSELEAGADIDVLLRRVVEDCEHNAILGVAAALALTGPTASAATLPLVTSARLWHWDMARLVRVERGDHANLIPAMGRKRDLVALRAANDRPARSRWIGNLATVFLLASEDSLRTAFQTAMQAFERDPTLDFAEEADDPTFMADRLRRNARWAAFSEPANLIIEQTDEGVFLRARPPPDEADVQTMETFGQTNRWLALGMWAARTFEEAPYSEGSLSEGEAIVEARLLDDAELFRRGGGVGDLEDLRRAGVAGVAAHVLSEPRFEDYDLLKWAEDVTVRAYSTPLGGEGWVGPNTILTHHPLKFVPIGLAGMIRRNGSIANIAAGLMGMVAHPVHAISVAAAQAAYSLADVEPRIAVAALQLAIALGVRNDTPLLRWQNSEEARDQRHAAINAAYHDAMAIVSGDATFALPDFPERHDDEEENPGGGLSDEPWLDTEHLTTHLSALGCMPAIFDDPIERLKTSLLAWTIAQSAGRTRRRGKSNLIMWRGALMGWLADRARPSASNRVIENVIAPICELDDEPCLQLLGAFIGRFVPLNVHDTQTVAPGTIAVMVAAARRLAALDPHWRSSYDADAGALLKDLLCVPDFLVSGARRFANGDWAEIALIWPILDVLLPALRQRGDFANAWLALLEHAIEHYPLGRFAREARVVLEALPAEVLARESFRARIGAVLQALDERTEDVTTETSAQLMRILDLLIDNGDRRAASLQRSQRFRAIGREVAK